MIKINYITCFLFLILFNLKSFGIENKFYINKLNHCKITKSFRNDYEPSKFETTNNLLRGTGERPIYCGKKIIIKGRVLDQNCVPVSDAKVYLWQVGCDGKYPYLPLRTKIDKEKINISNGSSFKGSGTATTNNLGEFLFITTAPPGKPEQSYINVRIEHRNLGKLQTNLVLSSHNILNVDNTIEDAISLLENDMDIYNFDIVIQGETLSQY